MYIILRYKKKKAIKICVLRNVKTAQLPYATLST